MKLFEVKLFLKDLFGKDYPLYEIVRIYIKKYNYDDKKYGFSRKQYEVAVVIDELVGSYHAPEIFQIYQKKINYLRFAPATISADYIYLNTQERQLFANAPREYLIKQLMFQ